MPGQVDHDAEVFILIRPVSSTLPVRRVIARYTAWSDGRWQVRIPGGSPTVIPGDDTTPACEALAAILHAVNGD